MNLIDALRSESSILATLGSLKTRLKFESENRRP